MPVADIALTESFKKSVNTLAEQNFVQNIVTFCLKVDYFEAPPLMADNEIQSSFARNLSKLTENTVVHDFLQKLLKEKTFVHELEPLGADCSLSDAYAQSLIGMKESNQTQGIIQALWKDFSRENLAITNVFPHFNKSIFLLHEQSMVQRLAEQITAQPAITVDAHLPPPDAKLVQSFAMQLSALAEQKEIHVMAQGLTENPLTNLETNVPEISNKTLFNDYAKSLSALHDNHLLQKLVLNIQQDMGCVLELAPLLVRDTVTKNFEAHMQSLQEQRRVAQLARLFSQNEQHLPSLSVKTALHEDFAHSLATLNEQKIIAQLSQQVLEIYFMGRNHTKLRINNAHLTQFSRTLQKSIEQKRIENIVQDIFSSKYNSTVFSQLTTRQSLTKDFARSLHTLSEQNIISCIYKEIRTKQQKHIRTSELSSKARQVFRDMRKLYEENHISFEELRVKCSQHPELQAQFTAYQEKVNYKAKEQAELEALRAVNFGNRDGQNSVAHEEKEKQVGKIEKEKAMTELIDISETIDLVDTIENESKTLQ